MEYQNVVHDFAERTRKNLKFVTEASKYSDPREAEIYEVTQLINSMLGLLVFPQQRFFDRIPPTPLKQLEQDGWPRIKPTVYDLLPGNRFPPDNLRGLVRYLRNAIAHFQLEFIADPVTHQIVGLKLWNVVEQRGKQPRVKHKDWEVALSLSDLREITDRFVDLVLRM